MTTKTFKLIPQPVLVDLCKIAEKRGYNRQLHTDMIEQLPDDEAYPVIFEMMHEHKAGRQCEPHIRAMILLPSPDRAGESSQVMLDCDMKIFGRLPTVEIEMREVA